MPEHHDFQNAEEFVNEVFDLPDTTSDHFDYTSADARRRALAPQPLKLRTPEFDYLDRPTGWQPRTPSLEKLDHLMTWLTVVVVLQALAILAIGAVLYVGGVD